MVGSPKREKGAVVGFEYDFLRLPLIASLQVGRMTPCRLICILGRLLISSRLFVLSILLVPLSRRQR